MAFCPYLETAYARFVSVYEKCDHGGVIEPCTAPRQALHTFCASFPEDPIDKYDGRRSASQYGYVIWDLIPPCLGDWTL